jgi:hypothetical protein
VEQTYHLIASTMASTKFGLPLFCQLEVHARDHEDASQAHERHGTKQQEHAATSPHSADCCDCFSFLIQSAIWVPSISVQAAVAICLAWRPSLVAFRECIREVLSAVVSAVQLRTMSEHNEGRNFFAADWTMWSP